MKHQITVVGGKIYACCPHCGKLIRLNKPVFGSLHFCAEETAKTELREEPEPKETK